MKRKVYRYDPESKSMVFVGVRNHAGPQEFSVDVKIPNLNIGSVDARTAKERLYTEITNACVQPDAK